MNGIGPSCTAVNIRKGASHSGTKHTLRRICYVNVIFSAGASVMSGVQMAYSQRGTPGRLRNWKHRHCGTPRLRDKYRKQ
ncbi:hypothetical protein L208DRAFT_1387429 [Tricholoma matsutake]|nr:hypothetical protein L208DRAFT_1387429 [Tricholoma matsutake 945]